MWNFRRPLLLPSSILIFSRFCEPVASLPAKQGNNTKQNKSQFHEVSGVVTPIQAWLASQHRSSREAVAGRPQDKVREGRIHQSMGKTRFAGSKIITIHAPAAPFKDPYNGTCIHECCRAAKDGSIRPVVGEDRLSRNSCV